MTTQEMSGNEYKERGLVFARRIFLIAGIYGVLVLIPQYFMESRTGRDFPPAVTHPEYYYGFIGVALAWQVLFLIMARDPVRFRLVMVPATLEKLSFGVAAVVLYLQGRLSTLMLAGGIVDLIFAGLFLAAFRATSDSP
jgi:hypothetical protein